MRRPVSVGAVLAGGQSSRMGRPKAMVELGGRPMLARVVGTVGSAGLEPIVVAKPDSELPHVDCRVLSEPDQPRHPLTGLVTALSASAWITSLRVPSSRCRGQALQGSPGASS